MFSASVETRLVWIFPEASIKGTSVKSDVFSVIGMWQPGILRR